MLLRYFNNIDWEVVFYNLNESASSERFFKITQVLEALNIEVLPPKLCFSCELPAYGTVEAIYTHFASPLVGVFRGSRLIAITIGITTVDQALVNANELKVFTPYGVYSLNDEKIRAKLEELFLGREETVRTEVNVLNLTSSIILLALSDSVNPCTFAVFTALLFYASYFLGKRRVAATGISFVLAVFIGYYALGLGLFQILAFIPYTIRVIAVLVIAFLGLVLGFFAIMHGLKPRFKSPVPKTFRRFMAFKINKSYASPMASFILGLISSFTLLPCSSGPYLVGLSLLSTLKQQDQAYLLLTLYNTIFVTPFIVILIAILASRGLSSKIKAFRSTRIGTMELISGTILTAVCIYLILSYGIASTK